MNKPIPLVLIALCFLQACSTPRFRHDGSVTSVGALDRITTEPATPEAFNAEHSYLIGALDKLSYQSLSIDGYHGEVTVDPSGRISLPLVGSIVAAGLTPATLQEQARQRMRAAGVRYPDLVINTMEINSQTVTVEGEVKEPGIYPVQQGMTLLRAIASARGLSELAKTNQIVVFRNIGDKHYAALYDLRAIRQGAYADPRLNPNDIVVVDRSTARMVFKDATAVAAALLTPLTVIITKF